MTVERKFIEDSVLRFKIADFMKNQLQRAGFSNLTIQKTPLITLITAEVTNPGRVIGRKGRTINEITERLKKEFGIDNPKINISAVSSPNLEPQVIADKLRRLIEMGKNPRRMMHFMIKSIMDAGAVGCEIVISGKLAAKGGRARTFRAMAGYLPKAGEPARWVKRAHVTAYPKAGAIGVLVSIAPPDVEFPDKKVEISESEVEPVLDQAMKEQKPAERKEPKPDESSESRRSKTKSDAEPKTEKTSKAKKGTRKKKSASKKKTAKKKKKSKGD